MSPATIRFLSVSKHKLKRRLSVCASKTPSSWLPSAHQRANQPSPPAEYSHRASPARQYTALRWPLSSILFSTCSLSANLILFLRSKHHLFLFGLVIFFVSVIKLSNALPDLKFGIWEITEPASYFSSALTLSATEETEMNALQGGRQLEWLATRYILHLTEGSPIRKPTAKSVTGKPYFPESDSHLSLSHSHHWAAAMVAGMPCGIDIQKVVPKIHRIAQKFLSPDEYTSCPEGDAESHLFLHAMWGAKEAMYKAYGAKELDFRQHISVMPFQQQEDGFPMEGLVRKNGVYRKYTLFCSQIQEYVLVYGVEQ